jgi:hypothetical protein
MYPRRKGATLRLQATEPPEDTRVEGWLGDIGPRVEKAQPPVSFESAKNEARHRGPSGFLLGALLVGLLLVLTLRHRGREPGLYLTRPVSEGQAFDGRIELEPGPLERDAPGDAGYLATLSASHDMPAGHRLTWSDVAPATVDLAPAEGGSMDSTSMMSADSTSMH